MKFIKHILIVFLIAGSGLALVYFAFIKKEFSKSATTPTPIPVATDSKISSNFSLEAAPAESLRGKITGMTGNVNFLGRVATEAAKLVSIEKTIQQGENYITDDNSSLSISFENAVDVSMSEKTEVDIIQTLPANLVFSQISGTAEYTRNGTYPVTVRTSYLLSQITGTVIIERNVDKSIVTVKINSGNVTFAYNDKNLTSHIVEAGEGQTFTFNYGTRRGVLK